GAVFFGALGILMTMAVGLWAEGVIRDLFSRSDWLGWMATAAATVAALAFVVFVARELVGLSRLASVEKMRAKGLDALVRNDTRAARNVTSELARFLSGRPETAAGRRALAELKD